MHPRNWPSMTWKRHNWSEIYHNWSEIFIDGFTCPYFDTLKVWSTVLLHPTFCLLVNKLDEAHKNDERLFELSGIDLNKAQNNLNLDNHYLNL